MAIDLEKQLRTQFLSAVETAERDGLETPTILDTILDLYSYGAWHAGVTKAEALHIFSEIWDVVVKDCEDAHRNHTENKDRH